MNERIRTEIFCRKKGEGFSPFYAKMKGKRLAVVSDENTRPFAEGLLKELLPDLSELTGICFPEKDLVPDEHVYETVLREAQGCEYVLAVGSGSLNDVCKYAGTCLKIPSGVLATAASMDGYLSAGAALMEKGKKVTEPVNVPEDVLVDPEILVTAPKLMTAAGFGDIAGKYTCLADWELAHILKGEEINREAFLRMEKARDELMDSYENLLCGSITAVETLMKALLEAGASMAVCGNSRPASGSEHHQSHFLEMDFVKRGEKIPPHGVKVAIGTLVSISLYRDLERRLKGELPLQAEFPEETKKALLSVIGGLPDEGKLKEKLVKLGCPVRFSEIGVRPETMEELLNNAYTVRDRYTILTLYHELNLMKDVKDGLKEEYY